MTFRELIKEYGWLIAGLIVTGIALTLFYNR